MYNSFMMKKSFFAVFFMLFINFLIFSTPNTKTTIDHKNKINFNNHKISSSFIIPFDKAFFDDKLSLDLSYTYENFYTTAQTGIRTSKESFKFFAADTFWFYNKTLITFDEYDKQEHLTSRLGARFLYNLSHHNDLVTYNCFLLGIDAHFYLNNFLSIQTELLCDVTLGNVYVENQSSLFISWWDLAWNLTVFYKLPIKPSLVIYLDTQSFDTFTINRLTSTKLSTGITYKATKSLTFGLETALYYTDIFSFSRYIEYATIGIKGEYLF